MDKESKDRAAEQIKEDMQVEWWRAADADQYSLKDKLLRVGCRPLKRKYLACKVI